MIDSLSKIETIHFKKNVSGLKIYLGILEDVLKQIEFEIINKKGQNCIIELKNLKGIIERHIKFTNKRMEMLK